MNHPLNTRRPTAIIAEDEPILAQALQDELAQAWPELEVIATLGDGKSALHAALEQMPDVLFLDIKMPVMSGLELAQELLDEWPGPKAFPAIVFVSAYDEYALKAFESRAIDYLLKPVTQARLAETIHRLQLRRPLEASLGGSLGGSSGAPVGTSLGNSLDDFIDQLQTLLPAFNASATREGKHLVKAEPLKQLQVGIGNTIKMVPINEVIFFEAADKYIRVILEGDKEYLIRRSLKELSDQLDTQEFIQIHRSVLVRQSAIDSALKDEQGRLTLSLKGSGQRLKVSRVYASLFRAM